MIRASRIGDYVPFKQSRLKGQANPLRPPLHVETVLFWTSGRPAHGLPFFWRRISSRDDGYVEAEFADGVRKFDTHENFKIEVTRPFEAMNLPDVESRDFRTPSQTATMQAKLMCRLRQGGWCPEEMKK
jgi:hypothetical protein